MIIIRNVDVVNKGNGEKSMWDVEMFNNRRSSDTPEMFTQLFHILLMELLLHIY